MSVSLMNQLSISVIAIIVISLFTQGCIKDEPLQEVRLDEPEKIIVPKSVSPTNPLKNNNLKVLTDTNDIAVLRKNILDLNEMFNRDISSRAEIRPKFWELCPIYFDLRIKEMQKSKDLFATKSDSILSQETLYPINKIFLESVLLNQNESNRLYNQPMSSVYNGLTELPSILREESSEKSHEYEMHVGFKDSTKYLNLNEGDFMKSHFVLNISEAEDSVFIFSNKARYKVQISSFNYIEEECNTYAYYDFSQPELLSDEEELLFASPFKISLEYTTNTALDTVLQEHFKPVCIDCPSSGEFLTSFANLSGYPNFYFTYAKEPTKKLDDTYTPMRRLIYYDGNLFYTLWSDSFDSFGCSCL